MTLYYTLVFVILIAEMFSFLFLVTPLPRPMRKKVFTLLHTSAILGKLTYTLRFTFIFILILFVDSVNRVYRVQIESAQMYEGGQHHHHTNFVPTDRTEVQARKFYAQRNMYLCGFTLFLSLILNRTYTLVVDLMNAEDQLRGKAPSSSSSSSSEDKSEVEKLQKELKQKDLDIEMLKKQASALSREYMEISDKVNKNDAPSDKKKD